MAVLVSEANAFAVSPLSFHRSMRFAHSARVCLAMPASGAKTYASDQVMSGTRLAERIRKNWLFVGSDDGGTVNATFTSLLASAQLCDVEPWSYLRDVFCLIPTWPDHELLELAPLKWKQTAERADVRERLAANRFRRLTLEARG